MNQIFSKPALLASAAFFAAATIVGCKSDETGPSATPAAIAANTSPPAAPTVASPVPGPTVKVTDASGAPVEGALVTFAVTAGGGVIQYPTATSDENGIASSGLWQIGPKVGVNTVAAAIEGVAPISFSVTSLPGAPSKVGVNSGDGQSAPQNTAAPNPLSVRVTDAGGNAKPGVVVTFAVTAGGGSIAGATATTDANGIATSGTWTFGSCKGQVVRASSGTLGTNFSGRATGQPAIVGGAAAGDLSTTDCVINGAYADEYDFAAAAGAYTYTMTAATFDALLNVTNDAGLVTLASDNNGGGGTNASLRLIGLANTKTVTATSAGAGQTGPYTLTVTSTSSDVTDCSPVYLEIGVSTSQTLAPSDCASNYGGVAGDAFLVYVPAGVTIRVTQTAQPLDALFAIISPSGSLIVERDNGGVTPASGSPSQSEVFTMTAATSGFYKIVASSYCLVYDDPYQANCDYGPYTLTVITP